MAGDLFDDLAALELPLPASVQPAELWDDAVAEVHRERSEAAERMRVQWEEAQQEPLDPLLAELAAARQRELAAERHKRLLIAYAREFVSPGRTRPYTLDQLASFAGMSISGVRTAYDDDEIEMVEERTGAKRRRPSGSGAG